MSQTNGTTEQPEHSCRRSGDQRNFASSWTAEAPEDSVRAKGIRGNRAMICEASSTPYAVVRSVNVKELPKHSLDWIATPHE